VEVKRPARLESTRKSKPAKPKRTQYSGIDPVPLRIADASVISDVHHEMRQDRVGSAEESTTAGHTLFRIDAGIRITRRGLVHSVTLPGENLGNELHREATSRIKDCAPSPGRNIALVYRVLF
jgi:iron complex outermembrane receptor protein